MTTYEEAMRARPGLRPRCSRIIVLEPDKPTKIGEYNKAHYTPRQEKHHFVETVPEPPPVPDDCDAGCSATLMCGLDVP